jgi:DNA-binding Xre family transcriptional regulator
MIRLRVKEVLESRGMTMAKLSRKADLAYKTVQDLCNDPYRDVSLSTLSRIQEALDCSVHDLVEDKAKS